MATSASAIVAAKGAGRKRVAFTFDSPSFRTLVNMKTKGQYATLGEPVRDAIRVLASIKKQASNGYSEVILRNPRTGREMLLAIPGIADDF